MGRAIFNAFARWIQRIKYIYYPARWDLVKYEFVSTLLKDKRSVLDVGCSDGYGSSILSQNGSSNAIGGDISLSAVVYAKRHYDNGRIVFLCFDATNLPFHNDSFDAVVALEVIEHLPEIAQQKLLSECARVLKNGGSIIYSTPNKHTYSVIKIGGKLNLNPSHIRELNISEYRDLLSKYCVDITFYGQWFMNSAEVIGHKVFLSICLAVEKFASYFKKDIKIGSFIYRIIVSIIVPRNRFKFLPLSLEGTKEPLDVVAVARVVKK